MYAEEKRQLCPQLRTAGQTEGSVGKDNWMTQWLAFTWSPPHKPCTGPTGGISAALGEGTRYRGVCWGAQNCLLQINLRLISSTCMWKIPAIFEGLEKTSCLFCWWENSLVECFWELVSHHISKVLKILLLRNLSSRKNQTVGKHMKLFTTAI